MSPGPGGGPKLPVRPAAPVRYLVAAVAVGIAVILGGIIVHDGGEGPLGRLLAQIGVGAADPLAPSGPAESVLRTLRLAGIEQAAVGQEDRVAIARIDVPGISSAADVEIVWQAGMAALAHAYPGAREYVVLAAVDGTILAEVAVDDGAAARDAVAADDAAALRALVTIAFYPAGAAMEREIPSNAVAIGPSEPDDPDAGPRAPEGYLDAKNRAAGLLGDEGPLVEGASELAATATAMREARSSLPAMAPTEPPAVRYPARVRAVLDRHSAGITGADALLAYLDGLSLRPSREEVARVRTWAWVVEALALPEPSGSVLAGVRATADAVAESPVPPDGSLAEAVLAAARSEEAPPSATRVTAFEREPAADHVPERGVPSTSLPGRVLALHASTTDPPALALRSPAGPGRIAPAEWLAYRRADGALYWLADSGGEVALTNASVRGWAFGRAQAAVVVAGEVGDVLEYFRAE